VTRFVPDASEPGDFDGARAREAPPLDRTVPYVYEHSEYAPPLAILHPKADDGRRRWPAEKFAVVGTPWRAPE
jgi:hypothetical protein